MTPNKFLTDYLRENPPPDSDEERDAAVIDLVAKRMERERAAIKAEPLYPWGDDTA